MAKRDAGRHEPGKREQAGRGDAQSRRQALIDRMLADALRLPAGESVPGLDGLAVDIRRSVDILLAKAAAQKSRCLTYEDLEEALPPRDVSAEDLEAIFWILAEHGIEVEDGEA
ncbi:RNA polymerase sigma factor region1.1 domain-containing protein, partial [uncultured Methylobacterium sp.]|uniref:RNA polymerase sigma factor region1.1 domain-containing protein n=1 Tax=uncultured Methylobacterium sp. TaxID=157278 RepID=UPI0035C9AF88